ncbi:hypothetical protein QBC38DRAFT_511585 [Podospora fimiseda]|uniref:CCHC-type domain-containing protein n=1 Tax=Podospora fimiseda TaxID=252190 RepID=A0AAN7H076_9PEZI|nr:hypothetical protein QBC38DRAFT_511585 [Podospora fimiseda]
MSWDNAGSAAATGYEWNTSSAGADEWNTGSNKAGGDAKWATPVAEAKLDDNSGGYSGGGDGDGDGAGAGKRGGCFNCGENGHNKSDCSNPAKPPGPCRRCSKEGHFAKECPDAPPMTCSGCGASDHLRRSCPTAEPLVCKECGSLEHTISRCPERKCESCRQTGHLATTCENARVVNRDDVEDKSIEEAWEMIMTAVADRDIDDVKQAIQIYVKANPDCTYQNLESAFRAQNIGLWLIPLEKPLVSGTLTNMDLQGNIKKKYTVSYRFQFNPQRPREREGWPKDEAESFERLADAGELVPSFIPKCRNCSEFGHMASACPSDKIEKDRVVIKCYNCDEVGHRVRDCPIPRVDKFACKNCGKPGHKVADCPEPRSAAGVECRKCNEMGHFSKDCPKAGPRGCRNCGQEGHMAKECTEPKNPANIQCRNCDEMGHPSKECPKLRDMSRVKCMNCQQMGHYKSRCPNPHASEDDGFDAGNGDSGIPADSGFPVDSAGGGGEWEGGATTSGGGDDGW